MTECHIYTVTEQVYFSLFLRIISHDSYFFQYFILFIIFLLYKFLICCVSLICFKNIPVLHYNAELMDCSVYFFLVFIYLLVFTSFCAFE